MKDDKSIGASILSSLTLGKKEVRYGKKTYSARSEKRLTQLINFISRREMYISRVKMYISAAEIYIPTAEMKFISKEMQLCKAY